ncbi:C-type lectin domain family 10 member A-like [Coregonus clupeaformis]|uniref:C-type lectin domain family 10 member A-like n=1 Tax=Coregonus clupeaformis TaxID=59861 RepID=UPI001E1C9546|nr:C-type lectin domain family 10 member A-like [Coregonus clupeaformis]
MSEGVYENSDGFKDDEPDAMKNTDIDGQLYANVKAFKPSPRDGVVASVHVQWWKRPSGVAAVCLGLLCVLLLAGIIGLSVYCGVIGHRDSKERNQLQASYNNLTEERDQLQTSYNTLTEERDQLQTSYNTLTEERDQLQTSYNNLTEERDQLQTSYNNLTEERDQLQTSYNNLTEERDQLQTEREILNRRLTNLKQTCSEGWQKFESSWYFLSTETKTWNESREDCMERGADLVIINSDEEQTFLINLKKRVWIGLTDSANEGTWKWVDGTQLTTGYWCHQQPDNGGGHAEYGEEDCALIEKGRSPREAWNDLLCGSKLNWICEIVV